MGTIIWIVISICIALVSIRRPFFGVACTIVLYIGLPYVAGSLLTGDIRGFHPASWLVLAWFAVTVVTRPQILLRQIGTRPIIHLAVILSIAGIYVVNQVSGTGGGRALMIDTILAPALFFLQVGSFLTGDPGRFIKLRNLILTVGVIEVAISVAGWLNGGPLFYVAQYSTKYWFANYGNVRALGTLDDPLTLALFLSVCIPLISSVKRGSAQLGLVLIFVSGILLTQSRTGLIFASISIGYLFVRKGASQRIRLAIAAGSFIAVFAFFFGGLGNDVLSRIADDNGSSNARNFALDYFFSIWRNYIFTGSGAGSSFAVGANGGLATSFESAILMYSIDFGVIFAAMYFVTIAVIAVGAFRPTHFQGTGLAALVAVVTLQTFSSVASPTAAGMLVWTLTAFASAQYLVPHPADDGPVGVSDADLAPPSLRGSVEAVGYVTGSRDLTPGYLHPKKPFFAKP